MATPAQVAIRPKAEQSKAKGESSSLSGPDQIFKEGFLADVFRERHVEKVVTRFPPEPNGYLHIGHSKAIAVNFGFARFHGGDCYLRLDDTNPKGEKEVFVDSIKELVHWLGFKPLKTTYACDYFDRLYELAESLILKDRAYVCHCTGKTPTEIHLQGLMMT